MEKCFIEYTKWNAVPLPQDLKAELDEIDGNYDEIWDRFCKDIAFGTSGLRGKMGAGTNRINSVVIRKASMGVAKYLTERYEKPGLVIGFDTRINSREYAASAAEVFAEKGVDAFIFSHPVPVPLLSFAVRFLGLNGGIMITASHNTKEYNGYKVYDHVGNQIDNSKAEIIEDYIKRQDPFEKTTFRGEGSGRVSVLAEEAELAYLEAINRNTLFWDNSEKCKEALGDLSVCYTPLNGTGLKYVTETLDTLGVGTVQVVESQKEPDGSFPTCPSPNPENDAAFSEALKICKDNRYDVILATDPDSDRMGAAVLTDDGYCKLSGNQVGELMFDYILRCLSAGEGGRKLRKGMVAFKSFVSSPLAEKIGQAYGVQVKNVFTGFKNIVYEVEKLKETGHEDDFVFGFEESLGYLYGNYTRDKDGVMACRMMCLMAGEQKAKGSDLCRRLEEIYEEYGYIESITTEIYYRQEKDKEKMTRTMTFLFSGELKKRPEWEKTIKKEFCYRRQNMYMADLAGGNRLIVRPSGTELKLKIYIFAGGKTRDEAVDTASKLCSLARKTLEDRNE